MFQKSVLSATYICSLQIPGNRLIQTLLIDSKSRVYVMTPYRGIGDSRNHPPIHSKEKNKSSISTNQKCGRKVIPNAGSSDLMPVHCAQEVWVREVCPFAEDPHSQRDKGWNMEESAELSAGDIPTGMKSSCQTWQYQSTPLASCIPTVQGVTMQFWVKKFFPLFVWEKQDPKTF